MSSRAKRGTPQASERAPLRRLFFDIETSPNVGFFWRSGYKLNIPYENIIHERKIITIAWKWQGEKSVHHLTWDGKQCDRAMIEAFLKVLARADEIVAHFGDGFDVPWVRARALIHGFNAFPLYKTIDTKAWACKYFDFNSNKLDYLAKVLGIGCKLRTEYDLWVDIVLRKNRQSLARMVRYNRHDVLLLERVYERLSVLGPLKTHVGVLNGQEKWTCPKCASIEVHKIRRYVTAKGVEQQQMTCRKCGRFFNISATARKQYDEARKKKADNPT